MYFSTKLILPPIRRAKYTEGSDTRALSISLRRPHLFWNCFSF